MKPKLVKSGRAVRIYIGGASVRLTPMQAVRFAARLMRWAWKAAQ